MSPPRKGTEGGRLRLHYNEVVNAGGAEVVFAGSATVEAELGLESRLRKAQVRGVDGGPTALLGLLSLKSGGSGPQAVDEILERLKHVYKGKNEGYI